ncbi:uncharacterized protein LOC123446354 [Hordeum vulgare subsp. vulgare]|uniref:Predicted protein n=1 Tax=Hordeum vulgare subsp. vulgare TaxID=112509 RepID=F2DFF6_HORVV|nr:uncharacterized protein LOC123446354 [Hordeum vulgare subsp. vulgare]BAJ93827.1 predicted protein [Hordeum vulgare subsp. vulgare]
MDGCGGGARPRASAAARGRGQGLQRGGPAGGGRAAAAGERRAATAASHGARQQLWQEAGEQAAWARGRCGVRRAHARAVQRCGQGARGQGRARSCAASVVVRDSRGRRAAAGKEERGEARRPHRRCTMAGAVRLGEVR